jgi:hypothetical protein
MFSDLVIAPICERGCISLRRLKTALRGAIKRGEIVDKLCDDFDEIETRSAASDSSDDDPEVVVCCILDLLVICYAGEASVCHLFAFS